MLGFCRVDVKLLGPDQEYEAPATVVAFRLRVWPEQTGVLLEAEGEEGDELTTTEVVPAAPVHPFTVTVTEYVPAFAEDTPAIEGFRVASVKLLGPDHVYVAPDTAPADKLSVNPEQIGLLLDAEGADGVWKIVTEVVPAGLGQPPTVAVNEYVPALVVATLAMVGF